MTEFRVVTWNFKALKFLDFTILLNTLLVEEIQGWQEIIK